MAAATVPMAPVMAAAMALATATTMAAMVVMAVATLPLAMDTAVTMAATAIAVMATAVAVTAVTTVISLRKSGESTARATQPKVGNLASTLALDYIVCFEGNVAGTTSASPTDSHIVPSAT